MKRRSGEYEPGWMFWSILAFFAIGIVLYVVKTSLKFPAIAAAIVVVLAVWISSEEYVKRKKAIGRQTAEDEVAIEIHEQAAKEQRAAGEEPVVAEPVEPLVLPTTRVPEHWPTRPGVKVLIDLADPAPQPDNAIEQAYAEGLTVLKAAQTDAPIVAFEHFRSIVAQDRIGAYRTANLLALLLAAEVGDIASLKTLLGSCLTNAKADAFAQRAIKESALEFYGWPDAEEPNIVLGQIVDRSALAAQLSLAACLLVVNQKLDAVGALEDALRLHESVEEPAGHFQGFSLTLCCLYGELDRPDAVFDLVGRYPFAGSELWRAKALVWKNLPEAAVVVLDEYLRKPESRPLANQARYEKAEVLVNQGELRRAGRELAKLYADHPNHEDRSGLRAKIDAGRQRVRRAAIPEDVRHAVWRRDQGRCVQCGSQENLEFDHVIPFSRGGATTERNLQLLCERCNREKSAAI